MSHMSTWICKSCGLSNYQSVDKCIACFSNRNELEKRTKHKPFDALKCSTNETRKKIKKKKSKKRAKSKRINKVQQSATKLETYNFNEINKRLKNNKRKSSQRNELKKKTKIVKKMSKKNAKSMPKGIK
eukprot:131818_1